MFAETYITLEYFVTMVIFENFSKGHAFSVILPKKTSNIGAILVNVACNIRYY